MEKSVGFLADYLREQFGIEQTDLRTYSPLTLAYIGDAVYDLIIRTILVEQGNRQPNKLHRQASTMVKASAQAELAEYLMPQLTEEEVAVYKRGRNAKSYTMAKNATMIDYRKATGFEALAGYLYLNDELERLVDLIKNGLENMEKSKSKSQL